MTTQSDFIVLGGGIAGATVAAELAGEASVILLEAEDRPGYHTTGRSAATFIENYGPPAVRALTRASRPFFADPPGEYGEQPLLADRGLLYLAGPGQESALEEELAGSVGMQRLDRAQCAQLVAAVADGNSIAGGFEAGAQDIDVDAFHQAALRRLRRRGGQLHCSARVAGAQRREGRWTVSTGNGEYRAAQVVNACGAWADVVSALFGARPLGLQPMRRSIAVVEVSGRVPVRPDWPLLAGVAGDWYCKPQGEWLMVSPADETPSEPCDAYADDLDLAIGIERMQQATGLQVRRLHRSWAGLRTFAPDRVLVAGPDSEVDGLFWLAGQGGYGIQTAPAMARLAAALLLGSTDQAALNPGGLATDGLSPARFQVTG